MREPCAMAGSAGLKRTDDEYAGLVKKLEQSNGKSDAASMSERATVLKQMADILTARRTTDRFQCYLSVSIQAGATTGTGVVTNIGAGGGFVKTTLALEKFADLRLEVRMTGRLPVGAAFKGQVRWVKAKDGIGFAFQELTAVDQELIKKLLGELVREQPPLNP